MKIRWLCMIVLLWAMPAGAQQRFTLVTEEQPPMNYLDVETGTVRGISTELVRAIMEKAGYDYHIQLMPWNRGFRRALQDKNTCIFTTVRTPSRESQFKWVSPLFSSGWAFYRKAGRGLDIKDINDVAGLVVTATPGTIANAGLADIPDIKLLRVPRDHRALVLLNEGRADLWVSGVFTAFIGGDEAGVVPELALLWRPIELSLACNRATDDEAIARLNAANAALDGLREKLKADHYLFRRDNR